MIPHGAGFIINAAKAAELVRGVGGLSGGLIRNYLNGKDIAAIPRGVFVIDTFGLTEQELRTQYPDIYQHLLVHVKPERDVNRDKSIRQNWWLHARGRVEFRPALRGLHRFIVTPQTAKHRYFVFLPETVIPDDKLIAVATDDGFFLGVLSSRIHVIFALASGSRLGVGNDPVYDKSRCFECFPFPTAADQQQARIRELAEALDAHRKRQQAAHPGLTMTGMYNVLEKLRAGEPLTDKEKTTHEQGLVSVLKQLHDDLDAAVANAYGWPADLPDDQILERLVALNRERAAEEARGLVRWLRPEFQNPTGPTKTQKPLVPDAPEEPEPAVGGKPAKPAKRPWPKPLPDRVRAIRTALAESPAPLAANDLAAAFKGAQKKTVAELLETLVTLGQARRVGDHFAA